MAIDAGNYTGREQAYIKHYLLKNYFSALIHKIASSYEEVVYVDGFSGPWQSSSQDFSDTSFGIALEEMRSAKKMWKTHGRERTMRAILVEKNRVAYAQLEAIKLKYPDIEFSTHNGEFTEYVPQILKTLSHGAFVFLFIDPKGWAVDIQALAPLLRRSNTEVLFNFMFDFINRAASITDPAIVAGLDALITSVGWRDRLRAVKMLGAGRMSDQRKKILVEAFSETLSIVGKYQFVAETPVFRPRKDRTLYSLIYATRQPPGIEAFRAAQIKTLKEQEKIRDSVRQATNSGAQTEAFRPAEMKSSEIESYLARERADASSLLLRMAASEEVVQNYGQVWPRVLEKHALTKAELNSIAAALRKSGDLLFPDWVAGKRVPAESWRVMPRQRQD